MVNIVESLKRPFKDTNKLLIGTLLGMIPVVNLAVLGYALVATGFTKRKVKPGTLPEWKDYTDLFVKGVKSIAIGLALLLPGLLVILTGFGTVMMSSTFRMLFTNFLSNDWISLMSSQASTQQNFTQMWTQIMPYFISAAPIFLAGIALILFAVYMTPVAVLGWLKAGEFRAAFDWKVLKKAATIEYLVNWIVVAFLSLFVNMLLLWIPYLGPGLAMYITSVFSYTVFAAIYEKL